MQGMNAVLIDSIAACGDVNRNVMAAANPVESHVHQEVYDWSVKLSEHLKPKTRAYHEIWLNGEKLVGPAEEEPILGQLYLPRKFKTAVVVPPHNDVDIYSQDLGFIAILDDESKALLGFNLTVGGGLGATHASRRPIRASRTSSASSHPTRCSRWPRRWWEFSATSAIVPSASTRVSNTRLLTAAWTGSRPSCSSG
jgi:sulfite reductase beta subunit-like hemoprotein